MSLKVVWDNGYEETHENVISIRIIKGKLLIALHNSIFTIEYNMEELKEITLYSGNIGYFKYEK